MENVKTDVFVMGTGFAGLGAALGAAEGGASVIVAEKRPVLGGISSTGMGIFGVESYLQRSKNVPLTKDDAFKIFMDKSHWKPDARLVREYMNKSGDSIDWLHEMGVDFVLLDQLTSDDCINQTGHLVNSPKCGTSSGCTGYAIEMMNKRALEMGVDIRMKTTVKAIDKNGGRYTVSVENGDGESYEIDARAVVIAAGGFSGNKEMLAEIGYEQARNYWVHHKVPLTGEGIRMAWKLGAVDDGMGVQSTAYLPGGPFPTTVQARVLCGLMGWCLPYLWVNTRGVRFFDEGNFNGGYINNAVNRQPGQICWKIFDSATREHIEKYGRDHEGYVPGDVTHIDDLIADAQSKGAENMVVADTLEELAEKIGVPVDAFLNTVEEYNECCDNHYDTQFAKNPKYLRPVRTGRFYAFKHYLGGYGTIGGIKINYKCQAMDANDDAISGLYAAGDCACGTLTHNYSLVYILWGATNGFALNTGRIAGENAAKYVAG